MKTPKTRYLDLVLNNFEYIRVNLLYYRKEWAQKILNCNKHFNDFSILLPNVVSALESLWTDKGVREGVARGFEYELNDSAL